MPINYDLYPGNWHSEIRPRILARAKDRCEWCGAQNYQPHPETGSKVVLTIAHLDHKLIDHSDSNLTALCQRCHLRHDAEQHRETSRTTRERKSGQLRLF